MMPMERSRLNLMVSCFIVIMLVACSGGGGGGGVNGGTRTYTVGGTVSGMTGTLVLQNNGADDVTIASDSTFTFVTALANSGTYSVTIASRPVLQNCAVSNATGIVNGSNVTNVSVACANKTWTHPIGLNDTMSPPGPYSTQDFSTAMSDNGTAIVAWLQDTGSTRKLFKSEYRNNAWTYPTSTTDAMSLTDEFAYETNVAMNSRGDAVITWVESDGVVSKLFKSESRSNVWTNPTGTADYISLHGLDGGHSRSAIDNKGNTIIAWMQYDGTHYHIFKSEYRNGVWSRPTGTADRISLPGHDCSRPKVAMDNNGNAVIVWNQSDGAYLRIFKSEYRNGAWSHPASTADAVSPAGQHADFTSVAMDDLGNAVIVWRQSDGTNTQVFKSEYRGGSWAHPASLADNISPNGYDVGIPCLVMDKNGNALITWSQSDGSNYRIFKSEYQSNVWMHPSGLSDSISPSGTNAYNETTENVAAMDDHGNALITWLAYDGSSYRLLKSEYRNGAWIHPAGLQDFVADHVVMQEVALDNNGNAILVYMKSDGANYHIYKSEFR